MVDGSFHGELLSVHKTTLVSLTHRISRINADQTIGYRSMISAGDLLGDLLINTGVIQE
jgi:hypothetical protein